MCRSCWGATFGLWWMLGAEMGGWEVTRGVRGVVQAMMKDQFANYVVQKVLETCDESQRELLLGRIRVHLHALKKYTYGKHIVARVEKLVAAGGESCVPVGSREGCLECEAAAV